MKNYFLTLILLLCITIAFSQKNNGWSTHFSGTNFQKDKGVERKTFPQNFKLYDLNLSEIRAVLFLLIFVVLF